MQRGFNDFNKKETYHTDKRRENGPAEFPPHHRSVAQHLLKVLIESVHACLRKQQIEKGILGKEMSLRLKDLKFYGFYLIRYHEK